jgi:hypothetical protein
MPIVVDINCLGSVFNPSAQRHDDFSPVKEYVMSGKGRLVFGGSGYMSELEKSRAYLTLFLNLRKTGQAVQINRDAVDAAEVLIRAKVDLSKCDDPHIIALLAVSSCPLLCTEDARSFPYVRDTSLYPPGRKKVKIYSSRRTAGLLRKKWRVRLREVV